MSLMLGTGPFGQHPAGVFNREPPERRGLLYFEDCPKRIRAQFAGETVVDSRRVKIMHEHAHLPVYYFPEADVRQDLLEPTDHTTRCPWKGQARYWSVRVGAQLAENAVWSYPEPIAGAPPIAGYLAIYWSKMDQWWEEDEEAVVHARDPYKRIDVLQTSRHVRVTIGGEVVAESRRPLVLYETGLPPRWYFPPEDVRRDLLVASNKTTGCAYKGFAHYWSVGDEEAVAWYYTQPRREAARIAGHVAFFNERVDLEVDGELQERPVTQWSPERRSPH
jgi:uncharacterized protein (DUF427 family)